MKPVAGAKVIASFSDKNAFMIEKPVGDNGASVIWVATACDNQWSNWTQTELYLPIIHQTLGHLTGLNRGGRLQEALIDTTSPELASMKPGVFQNGKSWQVVNVSPRESETERCSLDDFIARFGLSVGDEKPAVEKRRSSFSSAMDVRQNEVWHWILFSLVTMGTLEFFVANRTTA